MGSTLSSPALAHGLPVRTRRTAPPQTSGGGCLSLKRRRPAPKGPASPSSSRSSSPGSPRGGRWSPHGHWGYNGGFSPRFGGTPVAERGHYSFADDAALTTAEAAPEPEEEALSSGPLVLSTRLEYTSLRKGEDYNVFGLVSLQAAEAPDAPCGPGGPDGQRAPVDITCVLDVSGSMMGDKIQLVKEAVMFVIEEMRPGDRLSLVSFNSDAKRHIPLTVMDVAGKDTARQAMMRLSAGGGTSIARGLDCAVANMEQRRQRNPVGALFLLTDGQDGSTHGQVQQLVQRCREAQCALYAFGFGEDHDVSLLSSIAETAQTPFTFVQRLESIKDAFAGAVSGLMSVAAQGVELRIAPGDGCALAALHTHFTSRRESDGAATVLIPDVFGGERRDVVVELHVAAGVGEAAEGPAHLLRASARYRAVREGATVQTPEVCLEVERSAEPEGEPDAEVTAQRQRVEVTNALERAIRQGQEGRFEEARGVLEEHAQRLRSSPVETAVAPALLAEVEDAQHRLSSREEWERGGHAEVSDAMWMHRSQRCTNMTVSTGLVQKSSKGLYATSVQRAAIARSKR